MSDSKHRLWALRVLPHPVVTVVRAALRLMRGVSIFAEYTSLKWRILVRHADPTTSLAICAIFKDEAPYLAEWVTFHRLMGVDRFYLYDNRSTDSWRME